MRRQYRSTGLDVHNLAASPVEQFHQWFAESHCEDLPDWYEANAVTLATSDRTGNVTCRTVLMKGCDEAGLVFYTNYLSEKGRQLEENPQAALLFYWPQLERQVRVSGSVTKVGRAAAETYFRSRPRGSQIGAAISDQSRPITDRSVLDKRFDEFSAKLGDAAVPLPEHWGGYLLAPELFEFWQGRKNRLHDRLVYHRVGSQWRIERLQP